MNQNLNISKWTRHWAETRGLSCTCYPVTDSSNSRAKEAIPKISEIFHLFIAEKQTHGRGQGENIWLDSCFMASWLWRKNMLSKKLLFRSEDFASDLLYALKTGWPSLDFKMKNPNDIFLKDKKIAGILLEIIEQPPQQDVILGLGINVFSHPMSVKAGHLKEQLTTLSPLEWHYFLDVLHSSWNQRIRTTS